MLRDESGEALPSPPPRFHPHLRLVADAAMEFVDGRRRSTRFQTKEKLSFAPVQRRRRRGRRRRLAHLAYVRISIERARWSTVMWKRKMEAERAEAAILSGSGKHKMNGSGSGSSKKNIGSGSDKNLLLPLFPLRWYLRKDFFIFRKIFRT